MAQDDYAILVGISRYADAALHALEGPVRDVELVRTWLLDPQGGDVPEAHVARIVSDESRPLTPGTTLPPVVEDFLAEFRRVVFNADESAVVRHPNGRLYLYFSGHGFCERAETSAQAALYVANSTRMLNWNICGTYYAKWARDQCVFGEIVLIMDCCRDAELYKEAFVVPLRKAADLGPAQTCKLFELYAAPRGGKAQERPIPERGNLVYSLLTHAFMKALDHAAPGKARVSTQDVKGFLEESWDVLCAGQPADRPEIVLPSNGEIEFGRAAAKDLVQVFKLVKAVPGTELVIRAGDQMNVVATLRITGGEARIERDGKLSSVPIEGGRLRVPLPATFCLVTAVVGGALLQQAFQVGAGDVAL